MIFPKPIFPAENETHKYREGKWREIKKDIEELERQGWEVVTITGEPSFQFTKVELRREI